MASYQVCCVALWILWGVNGEAFGVLAGICLLDDRVNQADKGAAFLLLPVLLIISEPKECGISWMVGCTLSA